MHQKTIQPAKITSFIAVLCLFTMMVSCKKKDSEPTPEPISREVTYQLEATTLANTSVTYTGATGATQSASGMTLPWSVALTVDPTVASVTFSTIVSNATPTKTITAKIIVGGVVKRNVSAVVDDNGDASITLPAYTF